MLPSLLLCDFGNLAEEVRQLEAAGVHALHLDVMDGHFVPNLSYGLTLVAAFRRMTELPLDVHLMIANPEAYIDRYAASGADMLTIHVEAAVQPSAVLVRIKELGVAAGIAINPETPLERLDGCLDVCDTVLVMSVSPGFGGQPFNSVALERLQSLRRRLPESTLLEVDGGVNLQTIGACTAAGADLLVVGSAIFLSDDYGASLAELHRLAGQR